MERIESELVWNKYTILDEELSPTTEEHTVSGFNFNETDTIGNDSAYYEKFLLDDFDNYLDEIKDRLTVSRLVTDSIIKGMVNAVVEEAAEKVASKEAEIASLKERLQASSNIVVAIDSSVPSVVIAKLSEASHESKTTKSSQGYYTDKWDEQIFSEYLCKIRIFVESQIQRIIDDIDYVRSMNYHGILNVFSSNEGESSFHPQTKTYEKAHLVGDRAKYLRVIFAKFFDEVNDLVSSMKISTMFLQWEIELHKEIQALVLQNFIRDIHDECETKIFEQGKLLNTINNKYEQKIIEFSWVREELGTIFKSLLNSDQNLLSHTSYEGFEELSNTKWKDQLSLKNLGNSNLPSLSHHGENGIYATQKPPEIRNPMLEFTDYPHLKHMSREDLTSYYIIEMTKMRRQFDKAMEEKTDELFRLKREFLKEKGALLYKKDKELESVKNNIRRIILKLDDNQTEKEMLFLVQEDFNEFYSMKCKINSMFFENQRLRDLLRGKRKEHECLLTHVMDAESQILHSTSVSKNLLEQIENLKGDLEDLHLEVTTKENFDVIIWKEVIRLHKFQMEDAEMEANFIHDIYSVLFEGSTNDAMSLLNTVIMEKQTDQDFLKSMIMEKDLLLGFEIEANNKLRKEIISLSTLIKEKEKIACEACSIVALQKENFDLLNREISMLRDQVNNQSVIISENKFQLDSLESQLDKTRQQLHVYELEIEDLNHKLAAASRTSEDSEKQLAILNDIIKEKEKKIPYSNVMKNNPIKLMGMIADSWEKLSELFLEFESNMTRIIRRNESRLRILTNQCILLKQQVCILLKKSLWLRRMLDLSNLNMQKAEAEVDLLGDEVDALLSLLGKVYVALDHYSPVLQHYPGVMEILKLVRRELQGEKSLS